MLKISHPIQPHTGFQCFFLPEKSKIVPEKICKFLPEKILKVPEKKYKLKNTRENLKKSAREATREKIEKNPFLG